MSNEGQWNLRDETGKFKADETLITTIPNRPTLEEFFKTHVVELIFNRRVKPEWFKENRDVGHMRFQRRMLCTSNWRFISSPYTREHFKWVKPKGKRGLSWYRERNLVIVWDLMLNDWRMVSLDKYSICGYTPCQTLMEQGAFLAFYMVNVKNRDESFKKSFSDRL